MTSAKILVIDDDRDIVALVSGLLRAAGFTPIPAFDAMQGIMLAGREHPDLILLDMQLPAGGGALVLDRLAASFRTQSIPIVVLTASTQKGIDEWVRRKGAAAFIAKPVDRAALLAAVQQILAPVHP
jgi:CheY-like chemotaxis protein